MALNEPCLCILTPLCSPYPLIYAGLVVALTNRATWWKWRSASCGPDGFSFAILSILTGRVRILVVLLKRPRGEEEAVEDMEENWEPRTQCKVRPYILDSSQAICPASLAKCQTWDWRSHLGKGEGGWCIPGSQVSHGAKVSCPWYAFSEFATQELLEIVTWLF